MELFKTKIMNEVAKLKGTISAGPLGAIGGGIVGYMTAKLLGYEKTISVVSFTMVGLIIGAAIGSTIKQKL